MKLKSVLVECEIGGHRVALRLYLGRPAPGLHPAQYQTAWLMEVAGARRLSLPAADAEPATPLRRVRRRVPRTRRRRPGHRSDHS
jgi:hypothetical protein